MPEMPLSAATHDRYLSPHPAAFRPITLVLLIGIPGSGKSSLAAQLQQQGNCLLISTDQIRAKLFGDEAIQGTWRLVWYEVRQQLGAAARQIQTGQSGFAIYDATNTRRRNRREVITLVRMLGFTRIVGIWLDLPLALCLWRNQQRCRQAPEAVIQRMYRQIWSCPPQLHENLDLLLHYGTTTPNLEDLNRLLAGNLVSENSTEASTEIAAIARQEPNSLHL
jgi:predicted kinase